MWSRALLHLFFVMVVSHSLVKSNSTATLDASSPTPTPTTADTSVTTPDTSTTTPTVTPTTSSTDTPTTTSTETPTTATTETPADTSTETPVETSTESATTQSSTTTTTTQSSTTTTAAPQPNNRICPANSGMVDPTRVQAKTAHNYRRGRLARGEVKNKAGRNLPAASNMLRMEYNCTLESSAWKSAQRCSLINDPNLPADVQENFHLFEKSRASTEVDALTIAVKQWWSQIRVTGGVGQGVTYTQFNAGKPTEWFTRMAWATTQYFGCAVYSCNSYWNVVCHYKPGGNKLGQQIYSKGTPCSACPQNTYCNGEKLCQLLSTA